MLKNDETGVRNLFIPLIKARYSRNLGQQQCEGSVKGERSVSASRRGWINPSSFLIREPRARVRRFQVRPPPPPLGVISALMKASLLALPSWPRRGRDISAREETSALRALEPHEGVAKVK